MKIRAFLVDDEPKSTTILANKIERFCPEISIVGTSHNPAEAMEKIKESEPDLVFLDIQMPEMSGFEMLREFGDNPFFEVIFATAYDEYALEAIRHNAAGYILKPYDNDDLVKTVHRAEESIRNKQSLEKNLQFLQHLELSNFRNKKIIIPNREGLEFVDIQRIIHCEGVDGYTKINLSDGKSILSSQSIGNFVKLLPAHTFFQVHKSYIINLNFISHYLNEGYVVLENNVKIPVSRQKREELFILLKSK